MNNFSRQLTTYVQLHAYHDSVWEFQEMDIIGYEIFSKNLDVIMGLDYEFK